MKNTWIYRTLAGALFASAMAISGSAGPIPQQIKVTLPYPVMIGSTQAPAGEYAIQVLSDAASGPLMLFSSRNGFAVEAFATAIPLNGRAISSKTEIVLKRQGDTRELDKILVEGRDIGYEFLK